MIYSNIKKLIIEKNISDATYMIHIYENVHQIKS